MTRFNITRLPPRVQGGLALIAGFVLLGCGHEDTLAASDALRARGALTNEDAGAPDTTSCVAPDAGPTLAPKTLYLWPPNHKLHAISVEDCVDLGNVCGPLQPEFIWASSDEPVDGIGDGHFAPDILVDDDCQHLQVRSERQGPKDGRVYKLGVRVVDAQGRASEAVCAVIVDHDQRGVSANDSGESYRILLHGQAGLPSCSGEPPHEPPSDAGAPPAVQDAGAPGVERDAGAPAPVDAGSDAGQGGDITPL